MKIEELDKNLRIESKIEREGLHFLNAADAPFSAHGLVRLEDKWVRMPPDSAKQVSQAVSVLSENTAGGRVRFATDSPYIAIKTVQPLVDPRPQMTLLGQAGFDLYIDGRFCRSFIPTIWALNEGGYESVIDLTPEQIGDGGLHTFTINFPLYHCVDELYVGLKEGSALAQAPDYTVKTPMAFYGSSITQGAFASSPGTCYQNWLSRWFDADYLNLGFSGSALGEDAMAEYIAGLEISAFIYDYDYNSPTYETLVETHNKMLRKIRAAHPQLPIICTSRPRILVNDEERERRALIKANVDRLIEEGDQNIVFVSGEELFRLCGDEGTVDYCHPTDLGFYSMASVLAEALEKFGFQRK